MATSEKLRDNIAGTILDTEELHDEQVHLINDLHKVSRAKDLAREHELAAAGGSLAGQGNRHVAEMMAKVGALPVSKVEKQEEDRRKQKAEEALRLKAKADAEAEVEESIGGLSLEAEMRQAQKKAEKKARQKARKKLEKEAAAARAAASGEAQQTEPEGEAPVLLS